MCTNTYLHLTPFTPFILSAKFAREFASPARFTCGPANDSAGCCCNYIARCKLKCISHKLQSLKELNNFNPQINAKKFPRCCGIYLVCTYSYEHGLAHLFDDIASAPVATTFQDISPEIFWSCHSLLPHEKLFILPRARACSHNLCQSLSTSVRLGAQPHGHMVANGFVNF